MASTVRRLTALAVVITLAAALSAVVAPRRETRLRASGSVLAAASTETVDAAYRLEEPCVATGKAINPACLERAVLTSVRTWGSAAAMSALAKHVGVRNDVDVSCHPLAHAAGSLAFDLNGHKGAAELMESGSTTCGLGFIHGVLDALGESRASREELLRVAGACTVGVLALTGHCYDGIGHAAWTSSTDLDTAVAVCQALPTVPARELCGGGILMQMFDPARLKPTYPIAEAVARLPQVCASWPDHLPAAATEEPKLACWKGSAYLYALTITDAHWHAGRPDVMEDLPRWRKMMAEASAKCAKFGSDEAWKACAVDLGIHVGGPMTNYDSTRAAALCEGLPAEAAAPCKADALGRAGSHERLFKSDGTLTGGTGVPDGHQH